MGQSQAQVLVGQSGYTVHVQGQVPQVAGAVYAQLRVALNLVHLVAAQLDDVQIAVLVAHEGLLAVLDDLVVQAVQLDLVSVVVVGVLHQAEGQSRGLVAVQNEGAVAQHGVRAGAEGALSQALIECLVHRVEGGEIHQVQEVGNGNGQLHLQGLFVHCGDAQLALIHLAGDDLGGVLDLADVAHHVAVLGGGGGISRALPGEHEVVGGNGIAVGPVGILTQVEGVGAAVLAHLVALGNGGNGLTVRVHLHQAVGVVGDYLKAGAVGGQLGVQGGDLDLGHNIQHVAAGCGCSAGRGRRGGSAAGCSVAAAAGDHAQRQCTGQCGGAHAFPKFHVCVLLSFWIGSSQTP